MKYCFWILLLLVACAPREQPFIPQSEQISRLEARHFTAVDGAVLPYRVWLPPVKPTAVIVALHGMNDYSNAFALPGEYLRARGIALYAYDQRGFGASSELGIWPGTENMTRDLITFTTLISKRHPRTPLYVLGESMGGAVALSVGDLPSVKGLILVAPALWGGEQMNALYRLPLWITAHTLPFQTFTGSDLKILATDNIPLLRAMAADPLIIKATRADAIYGLVALMDNGYNAASQVILPTLLLYGGKDQVMPPWVIESAKNQITAPLTYHFYPNAYHMLLRDIDRKKALEDIVRWIQK